MSDLLWSAYVTSRANKIMRNHSRMIDEWLIAGAMPQDIAIERGPIVARIDGELIIIKQEARII